MTDFMTPRHIYIFFLKMRCQLSEMKHKVLAFAILAIILSSFYVQLMLHQSLKTRQVDYVNEGSVETPIFAGEFPHQLLPSNDNGGTTRADDWGRNSTIHFFHLNKQTFVDRLQLCILDPECQVMYHHVQKASGTYIGSRLFPWMNNRFPNAMRDAWKQHQQAEYEQQQLLEQIDYMLQNKDISFEPPPLKILTEFKPMTLDPSQWCCYKPFMNKFLSKPDNYCGYKFSTWEVNPKQMAEIANICHFQQNISVKKEGQTKFRKPKMNVVDTRKAHRFTRAAIMVSYREPVGRTTSLVHQLCNEINGANLLRWQINNGNWNSLNFTKTPTAIQEVIDACRRCNYTAQSQNTSRTYKNDADIWDHLVRDSNKILSGVSYLARSIQQGNHYELGKKEGVELKLAETFILDTRDVSEFFKDLQARFRYLTIPEGDENSKRPYRVCHFNTTSYPVMMAGFFEGQQSYMNLTRGFLTRSRR